MKKPFASNGCSRTGADGDPSARIADCARTKSCPHTIGDLVEKPSQAAFVFIHNRVFFPDAFYPERKHGWRAERAMAALGIRR
jgi:hypothetical protein